MAFENFEAWFQKLQFGGKQQQAFLEDMSTLVADGVSTRDAVDAIQQISKGAKQLAAAEIASAISRGASLAEGMFDSTQSKMYQDMADQQLASDLSMRGGLGLQDAIIKQLGSYQLQM